MNELLFGTHTERVASASPNLFHQSHTHEAAAAVTGSIFRPSRRIVGGMLLFGISKSRMLQVFGAGSYSQISALIGV